jgi:UTP--glucose-1-phosphate uridylyltransferase
VPENENHLYGICGVGSEIKKGGGCPVFPITQMVEKPEAGSAPSRYAISGRYVLQPEIFSLLAAHKKGSGNEIQITDAMIELAKTSAFFASLFPGVVYDCGTKIGFLKANMAYALTHPDLKKDFQQAVEEILRKTSLPLSADS